MVKVRNVRIRDDLHVRVLTDSTISNLNKNAGPDMRYIVLFSSRDARAYHDPAMLANGDDYEKLVGQHYTDSECTWVSCVSHGRTISD